MCVHACVLAILTRILNTQHINENCYFFQIDPGIIKIMPDEDLKKYIPAYGDRIALKRFCSGTTGGAFSKKATLLQKLKQKIKLKASKSNRDKESDEDSRSFAKLNLDGSAVQMVIATFK